MDAYLEHEFAETTRTGQVSEDFKVPKGELVKKRWVENLFDKGVKKPKNVFLFVLFFKAIVERSPSKFTMDDLHKLLESKVIAEFQKAIDSVESTPESSRFAQDFKTEIFATALVKNYMLTISGIINIWYVISKKVADKWYFITGLVLFIKNCSEFVRNASESEMILKLKTIKNILKTYTYDAKISEIRPEMRIVLKYIDELIEDSSPEIPLQTSEEYERIDDRFKEVVYRILNRKTIHGVEFKLRDTKIEAKFYFNHAIISTQTAREFGSNYSSILGSNKTKIFKSEIISLCERQFIRQQSKITKSEYSIPEVLATNRFICELLAKKQMPAQKGDNFVKFINSQDNSSTLSVNCIAQLLTAKACCDAYELKETDA